MTLPSSPAYLVPDTVEDPFCLNTTAGLLPPIVFLCVVVFLLYNVKVWGLPLVLISIIVSIYTLGTILNWYFFGADGQNKYLMTILSSEEPRSLAAGYEVFHDALANHSAGFFGRFMNVLMLMVFPYIVLGSLFGRCAGGQALIKLAFLLTRNLRGGPAHAAVFFGHVRHDYRRACGQRALNRGADHPDDAQARVLPRLCRRR